MTAHVVESIDVARTVTNDDQVIASNIVAKPVSRALEARGVRHKEPSSREDGSPLETVKVVVTVPRCGQCADWFLLIDCRAVCGLGVRSETKIMQH